MNADLQDKFDKFVKKVYTYINSEHRLVKAVQLLQLWCRSSNSSYQTVHVLGTKYYLMSAFDLDRLCEWVYAKRSVCNDTDVTADILLQCNEQCIEQAVEVVYEEEGDVIIKYTPVCSDWQQEQCKLLGLEYITGNHTIHTFIPAFSNGKD